MIYDSIIIGAGAAGLMTAITAARGGAQVLLLDGQKKIGAKILMSGGTRCNVTNKAVSEKDYNSGQRMRVRNILRGFDNIQAIRFFKEIGVELVLEPTGKYFPTTHSGKTVLDALLAECGKLNIEVKAEHKVEAVTFAEGIFTVRGNGFGFQGRTAVLTTGGLSYPGTGSDGIGFRIAQSFGHTVLDTMPALTPLTTDDEELKSISGIALPVALDLYSKGKKKLSMTGDFLFTHIGFSGPVALDISRHWLACAAQSPQIFANFFPEHTTETFTAFIQDESIKHPKKTLRTVLTDRMAQRMAAVLLAKQKLDGNVLLNQLGKEARRRLAEACTHYPLAISGAVGYSKAEVTAGGVDLAEVNPKTLESNEQQGLFLAGEVLDVDGRIGGFNFQWAWASGHAAGQAIARKEKK